jgi:type I restriction enzyme R subunit
VPTRQERADRLSREDAEWLGSFPPPAREVLEVTLEKYVLGEAENLADTGLLRVPPLNERGTFMELAGRFGGGAGLREALTELRRRLYNE